MYQKCNKVDMDTGRSWCFTLNNYTEEDIEAIKSWTEVARIVVGKETGDKGTPHLQGAVTFRLMRRLSALKKLNNKIHWERMMAKKDHGEAAFEYCRKDGDVCIDIDTRVGQGARTDIAKAYEAARGGVSMREFTATDCPSWQALKVFEKISGVHAERTLPEGGLNVIWVHGASGTGKTRMARELSKIFVEFTGKRFFSGYAGEETMILDDIKPTDWLGCTGKFLKMMDRYPFQMEIKGGSIMAMYHTLMITCIRSPEEFWAEIAADEPVYQLTRRIKEVRFLGNDAGVDAYDML